MLESLAAATIVFLGDSITAGHGIAPEAAYPALVERHAAEAGLRWKVVNAGVSGDTTAGGLSRLSWVLKAKPDLVVVELGANDGLRGTDPAVTRRNLDAILSRLRSAGVPAVLAGMRLPPNYGAAHVKRFERLYPELARKHGVPLLPFILDGVAANPALNLADGIHPNEEGHKRIARNVFAFLRRLPARR